MCTIRSRDGGSSVSTVAGCQRRHRSQSRGIGAGVVGLVVVALVVATTGGCAASDRALEAHRAEMVVLSDAGPSGPALASEPRRPDARVAAPAVPAAAGGVGWARGLLGGAAGVALGGWWQAVRARLLGASRRSPDRRRSERLRRRAYRFAAGVLVLVALVQLLVACSARTGARGGAPVGGGTAAPGGVAVPPGVPPPVAAQRDDAGAGTGTGVEATG